jgi:hypothetical protein
MKSIVVYFIGNIQENKETSHDPERETYDVDSRIKDLFLYAPKIEQKVISDHILNQLFSRTLSPIKMLRQNCYSSRSVLVGLREAVVIVLYPTAARPTANITTPANINVVMPTLR